MMELYHTGIVVADLEAAMAELTDLFGYEWTGVNPQHLRFRTPSGEDSVELNFVYTLGQGHHIELVEARPGTVWELGDEPHARPHHLGYWCDDVTGTSRRLAEAGMPLLCTYAGDPDNAVGFAYHRLHTGQLVELVDSSRRAGFEEWFAGGQFPAPASARAGDA